MIFAAKVGSSIHVYRNPLIHLMGNYYLQYDHFSTLVKYFTLLSVYIVYLMCFENTLQFILISLSLKSIKMVTLDIVTEYIVKTNQYFLLVSKM